LGCAKVKLEFEKSVQQTVCLNVVCIASSSTGSVVASSTYEKACVLFSIAALHTQLADSQNMSTDDGLKTAAKLLQVSYD
jgi:BRO1-like domain